MIQLRISVSVYVCVLHLAQNSGDFRVCSEVTIQNTKEPRQEEEKVMVRSLEYMLDSPNKGALQFLATVNCAFGLYSYI